MHRNTQPASPIQAVPTNIITGFLGVGKTSAILHLLQHKPADERWAILVNEFGEIGIDGNLMSGAAKAGENIFIKEVPGGCMCCAANLPMQIALNQLLARSRPHRLLIEPTGLGHPQEILDILSAPHYADVVSLQNTLTLVDARKLNDVRYTGHRIFNQQLDIADCVVANKQALYSQADRQRLERYLHQRDLHGTPVIYTDYGKIPLQLLAGADSRAVDDDDNNATAPVKSCSSESEHQEEQSTHSHHSATAASVATLPESGFLRATNRGEGFEAIGWRIASRFIFSREAFFRWALSLPAIRLKAVVITDEGTFGYNFDEETQTEKKLVDGEESRLEIIAPQVSDTWEQQLKDCIKA